MEAGEINSKTQSVAKPAFEAIGRIKEAKAQGRRELDLQSLSIAEIPPEIAGLPWLQSLDLRWCDALKDVRVLSRLPLLQSLNLRDCRTLRDIDALSGLTQLRSLSLDGCDALADVSVISKLTRLQSLNLRGCGALNDVSLLSGLPRLLSLNLSSCDKLIDVGGLSRLTQLRSLDLSFCRSLTDVTGLSRLVRLQSLKLSGCEALKDISALSRLTRLRSLNLIDCRELRDWSVLSGMLELQWLKLGRCHRFDDVSVLSGLTQLRSLDLRGCHRLKDVTGLSSLKKLQVLQLGECSGLEDSGGLIGLTNLQSLDLSGCRSLYDIQALTRLAELQSLDLSSCHSLEDARALSGLSKLQSLNLSWCDELKNLEFLSGLPKLQSLGLSWCETLGDISCLTRLTQLRSLDLSGCSSLKDVSALSALTQLRWLDLSRCRGLFRLAPLRERIEHLFCLHLEGAKPADVPVELCGGRYENVRDAVLAYFRARNEQDPETLAVAKVLLVGNGRAGKTSLSRRLQGEALDLTEPTTHAIRLESWDTDFRPVDAPASSLPESVALSLWDFGGQDLYHHTHRLFFQGASVFVIVWTAESPPLEAGTSVEENPFRPLAYWIDQVRSLNPEAHIVLVRNKRVGEQMNPNWRQVSPMRLREDALVNDAGVLDLLSATEADVQRVRDKVSEVVAQVLGGWEQRERPAGWLAVARELSVRQSRYTAGVKSWEQGGRIGPRFAPEMPVMSVEDFKSLVHKYCRKSDGTQSSDVNDPIALLTWLHGTGTVYWRSTELGGRVLAEQRWAIEGIYSLLDRATECPGRLRENGGLFSPSQAAVWRWNAASYRPDEQKLFLDFMRACGFAVEVLRSEETIGGEPLLLAPYFLPDADAPQAAVPPSAFIRRRGEDEIGDTLAHETLGRDTAQAFIVRVVRALSRSARVWKYGAYFSDLERRARALVTWAPLAGDDDNFGGQFTIKVLGEANAAAELIAAISDEIDNLAPPSAFAEGTKLERLIASVRETFSEMVPFGRQARLRRLRRFAPARRLEELLKKDGTGSELAVTDRQQSRDKEATTNGLASVAGTRAERVGRRIAISCSGDDATEPGIAEAPKRLHRRLLASGAVTGPVVYYRAAMSEADIDGITAKIARADYHIVFLSRRYLWSRFCMAELLQLYLAEPRGSFPRDRFLMLRFASAKLDADGWKNWRDEWQKQSEDIEKEIEELHGEGDTPAEAAGSLMTGNYVKQWLARSRDRKFRREMQRVIESYAFNQRAAPLFDPMEIDVSRKEIDAWLDSVVAEMNRHLPRNADGLLLISQLFEAATEAWKDGDWAGAKALYVRRLCSMSDSPLERAADRLVAHHESDPGLEEMRTACLADLKRGP